MRHLRRFCAVSLLVCAFSFSAYAGNIECDVMSPPPKPEETASETDIALTDTLLILIEEVLLVP